MCASVRSSIEAVKRALYVLKSEKNVSILHPIIMILLQRETITSHILFWFSCVCNSKGGLLFLMNTQKYSICLFVAQLLVVSALPE